MATRVRSTLCLCLAITVPATCLLFACETTPTEVAPTESSPVRVLGKAGSKRARDTRLELEGKFEAGTYVMPNKDEYREIKGYPFGVSDLRGRTLPNGIKQVQAVLINNSSRKLKLKYRFQFFDEAGFELESAKYPWLQLEIQGGNQAPINGTSYSGRAASFRIYVR